MDVRQSSFSELLAANSLRTALTSTAGWGDVVGGDAVGGVAVVGTEPVDAVAAAVVGVEPVDAVTGATEAGLPADEEVGCPKTLDIRLENIPIRIVLVKDGYYQDFAPTPSLGR